MAFALISSIYIAHIVTHVHHMHAHLRAHSQRTCLHCTQHLVSRVDMIIGIEQSFWWLSLDLDPCLDLVVRYGGASEVLSALFLWACSLLYLPLSSTNNCILFSISVVLGIEPMAQHGRYILYHWVKLPSDFNKSGHTALGAPVCIPVVPSDTHFDGALETFPCLSFCAFLHIHVS